MMCRKVVLMCRKVVWRVCAGSQAAWRVLEALQEQGVIGQLGISNCYDLTVLEAIHKDAKVPKP